MTRPCTLNACQHFDGAAMPTGSVFGKCHHPSLRRPSEVVSMGGTTTRCHAKPEPRVEQIQIGVPDGT
jgi:hypothetical protein